MRSLDTVIFLFIGFFCLATGLGFICIVKKFDDIDRKIGAVDRWIMEKHK